MSVIMKVKKKEIEQFISKDKRTDGRELNDYREIRIEQGLIERA